MSAMNKDVGGGDQNGSSDAVEEGSDATLAVARHIAERAVGLLENLPPDAATQLPLLSDEERSKYLDVLVLSVAPPAFDISLLITWLNGGRSPFPRESEKKGLGKVGKDSEWSGQTLVRSSPRVGKHERKIEALRAALAQEEQRLLYAQAHERAAIQWFVTDHLISLLSPVFALGPAWTLLRALSAHLPDEVAEDATDCLFGREKQIIIGRMRADRQAETDEMLKTLDFLSGIPEFEEALRAAILKVVREFGARRASFVTDGRRPRSKEAMKASIHPKAQSGMNDVLDGLKQAN